MPEASAAGYVVRPVAASEWIALRAIRLAALRDSPRSFWSRYEEEAQFPEERWRERASAASPARNFLAWHGDDPVGLIAVVPEGPAAHIVSVWVAPEHRNRGVARSLLDAALGRARELGVAGAVLWVARHNTAARSLYERFGFTATGAAQPLPWDTTVIEEEMRLALR